MNPAVSIAFPCWNRGRELRVTLETITRQNYSPLELVVVEEEDDGLTESVAKEFGVKYVRRIRTQPYPIFQSIASQWNQCARESSGEILLLQTAEVLHESDNVIGDLVERILSKPKIMATPLIKDLAQDGSQIGWYNHPTDGSRPGWVSGAGPHAIRREDFFFTGGYEELFYGYGSEDDYWMYLLRKNGFSIEYVESAVCAHQWHERTKFEPVTGYANRALIRTLTMEIEEGRRKPLANCQPLSLEASAREEDVTNIVLDALNREEMSRKFKTWAVEVWINGNRNPDITFVYQRDIANEGNGRISEIGEMITEAAWGVVRAREAYVEGALAANEAWSKRALQCAQVTETWASRALARARKLMETK